MKLDFLPGLYPDHTGVSDPPRWNTGYNVRFRGKQVETMGLYRPLQLIGGGPAQVPVETAGRPNFVMTTVLPGKAQIIVGCLNGLFVLEPDTDSTLSTGTRWEVHDITPDELATITDEISVDLGRVKTSPAWWGIALGATMMFGRGGQPESPFSWDRDSANEATEIEDAPTGAVAGMMSPNRHIILVGADGSDLGFPGPCIRWANQETVDEWESSSTGTAGGFEVPNCSKLIGGGWTAFDGTFWSDTGLSRLRQLDDDVYIFALDHLSSEAGLLAQKMWCEHDGMLWWLGQDMTLRRYQGGTPQTIPSTVGRETFDRMSRESAHRGFMNSIGQHGEVWAWIPNGEDQLPDRAAVWSNREQVWTIAKFDRACMCDRKGVMRPIAVAEDGTVYEHEAAIIDDTPSWANDEPAQRSWLVKSCLWLPPTGTPEVSTADVTRCIIDMKSVAIPGDEDAEINVTITGYDWLRPNPDRKTADPATWAEDTDKVDNRVGGRSFDLQLDGDDKTERRIGDIWIAAKKSGSER